MRYAGLLAMVVAATLLAACGDKLPKTAGPNDTAVLGGYAPQQARTPDGQPLTDGSGQAIPPPPIPAGVLPQAARVADDAALAVWVQDDHVVASAWSRAGGWTAPQALEAIYGKASDPQIASNGGGSAMAVWRHTVGSIQSLRFSRFEPGTGWTVPDVMPGALPRADVSGTADPTVPRLAMDAQGNVVAQWASGFAADEVQVARFVAGQGWSAASSERVAAQAPVAAPR